MKRHPRCARFPAGRPALPARTAHASGGYGLLRLLRLRLPQPERIERSLVGASLLDGAVEAAVALHCVSQLDELGRVRILAAGLRESSSGDRCNCKNEDQSGFHGTDSLAAA